MHASAVAVETVGLRKVYGSMVAVADLTLRVGRGEVFGFLGPNGAGKTTSMKMLLGLVHPTHGTARLLGRPIDDPACRRSVGFLPEHFRFHDWMRADEFLDAHGKLCGLERRRRQNRARELLDLVGLSHASTQRLGTFSKGMLQRIGLAQALLHDPELVFLDEPTSGLDPLGRRMVRDVISHLASNGVTVFLNSHLLSEVEATCTRVAFIRRGEVLATTSLDKLGASLARVRLELAPLDERILRGLARWCDSVRQDGDTSVFLELRSRDDVPEILRWLVELGVDVYAITPETPTLEELFVEIMAEEIGETNGHHS